MRAQPSHRASLPAIVLAFALAVALASAGCASGPAAGEGAEPRETSTERLEAIYRARIDSARMHYTEADVRFMTGMIAHHAQAIVMSRMAPERASDPAIRTLAARIINAQRDEITRMQQWLRDRGEPVPEVDDAGRVEHGAMPTGEHAMHDMDAPGMLTPEQLRELERARGPAFDRLFLRYMIQHHSGAVAMVHDLFAQDAAGQDEEVFRLASDIQVDQVTEIARMEQMLDALPPAGGVR